MNKVKIVGSAKEPNYDYQITYAIGRIVFAILLVFAVIWLMEKGKKAGFLLIPIALYQTRRIFYPPPLDFANQGSFLERIDRYKNKKEDSLRPPSTYNGRRKI